MATRDKLKVILQEMKAADEYGPGGRKATGSSLTSGRTRVFDARALVNEVRPEVSLHYCAIGSYQETTHQLEYLVIRETGEMVIATPAAVEEWLSAHPSDMGQEAESSLRVLRRLASALEPDARKRVMRHQALIQKEFRAQVVTP
jgi:hypothetical protein